MTPDKRKGFTLVELLIVVAIIGVLSTVGVPTFRKMVQKAKQSEAKVNLGALYTAEAAFQSEENTYGTDLVWLGYVPDNVDLSDQSGNFIAGFDGLTYSIGFLRGPVPCSPFGTSDYVFPLGTTTAGARLNARIPAYYINATPAYLRGLTRIGFSWCPDSSVTEGGDGTIRGFTAHASGVISGSVKETDLTSSSQKQEDYDVWSIDHNRVLSNTQSGIK